MPRKTVEVSDPISATDHNSCRNRCHAGAALAIANKTGSTGAIKCAFSGRYGSVSERPHRDESRSLPGSAESDAMFPPEHHCNDCWPVSLNLLAKATDSAATPGPTHLNFSPETDYHFDSYRAVWQEVSGCFIA